MTTKLRAGRIWCGIGAAGLVMALLVVARLALWTDPQELAAMHTPGAILGVTRGSAPLILGSNWQKAVLHFAPEADSFIGGAVLRPRVSAPIIVWQKAEAGFYSGPPQTLDLTLTSERGERLVDRCVESGAVSSGVISACAFPVSNFPRRGKLIQIRAAFGSQRSDVDRSFTVPNPSPGNYPVWKSERLPARRQQGALELVLSEFQPNPAAAQAWMSEEASGLRFRVLENRKPAGARWAVDEVSISDPTGNQWEFRRSRISNGDAVHVSLPLELPDEPAYRVRVRLVRNSHFPAADRCVFPSLPASVPGKTLAVGGQRAVHGHTLSLTHIIGANANNGFGWISGGPTAAVRVSPPVDSLRLWVLDARNGTGFPAVQVPGRAFCVDLPEKQGSRTDLHLALTPVRTMEFLLRAERPSGPV